VPSGSGGTHAGILAGLADHSSDIPVTGISVNKPVPVQEPKILDLANRTLELLASPVRVPEDAVRVLDGFVGAGYSLPTPEMAEAIQLFARTEGVLLDPVYTGKQAAGLIGMIRSGELTAGQRVLFLHTGGSPALSAYPDSALPAE
jgi:D-cysteine desulfhydrase